MNPMQMIKTMVNAKKNPQELVSAMVGNNSNPMIKNLAEMAKKGDNKGVESFARNLFKEKGLDFDKEFSNFMSNINK